MIHSKIAQLAVALCLCTAADSQNYIDQYFTDSLTYTEVLSPANNISFPRDLDFKPNSNELWVVNKGVASGGSIVIAYNAGTAQQTTEYRKDTHTGHFMIYPPALAFGDNGQWACVSEIKNTASPNSTFMGPALWTSDTGVFARVFQNNWVNGYPLGSHYDMLHQSPFAMGIAHDSATQYWVTDGYNGNICLYNFGEDHGPGHDDHSDGVIWRYTDVPFNRVINIAGHLVLDSASDWLYYVNSGTKELRRMNTNTGTVIDTFPTPATAPEPLAGYWDVQGSMQETIDSFMTQVCGIDVANGRLIVGDYDNGNIYVYDVTGAVPVFLDTIETGYAGMMGVKIGPDGKIWFVSYLSNRVYRIDMTAPVNDVSIEIVTPIVIPFKANFYNTAFDVCDGNTAVAVKVINTGSTVVDSCMVHCYVDGTYMSTTSCVVTLAPGSSTILNLPAVILPTGEHTLLVRTDSPNATSDGNPGNNSFAGSFRTIAQTVNYPYLYGFATPTFPADGWSYTGYNFNNQMSRIDSVGGFGNSNECVRMDNFSGGVNIIGQRDYLLSPRIDLSGAPAATSLSFSVAYSSYYASDSDSLIVKVSTDCGSSWSRIYADGGSTLVTADTLNLLLWVPEAHEWRTEIVSLSPFVGSQDVIVMFETRSSWGNELYIDDIRVEDVTGVTESAVQSAKIYPNPSNGLFAIDNAVSSQLTITDMSGRILSVQYLSAGTNTINLSSQAAGTYFITLLNEDETTFTQRIIVE